jgi:hypothetical protein
VATKAMAARLARLVYRMLRFGMKYVDQGAEFYEAQHRKQQVIHLKRKTAQLGLGIIELLPRPKATTGSPSREFPEREIFRQPCATSLSAVRSASPLQHASFFHSDGLYPSF